LTRRVLEAGLEAELTEHVGYAPYDPAGHHSGNSRNGTRSKTVITEIGPVQIEVPRDRACTFEPVLVPKRKRRLGGVDQMVLSLSAEGLTHGEIAAHLEEVYATKVSKVTITRITDSVIATMTEWQNRPLDRVYPVVFIDAIHVKIREGQVANRPIYVAVGLTVDGERDILGLWIGDGGEGAKYWLHVLTEVRNRGTADVCIVVCDGLTGLPDAVGAVWPQAIVQTCIVHLLRSSFRYASRKDWPAIARDLKTGLHRPDGGRRLGPARQLRRRMGGPLPRDRAALGERVGRVRPVPRLPRRRPRSDLHNERYRKYQRQDPESGQGPGAFPDRDRRPEMRVSRVDEPRPHRAGTATLDQPLEASIECFHRRVPRAYTAHRQVTEFTQREEPVTPLI
jgi:transposase-like protein